jgi:CheY-like chemotaxis protein
MTLPVTKQEQSAVLLVAADRQARNLIRRACESEGFTVVAVADRLEAMHRIETDPPDAIVLDLEVGGLDLLRDIRAHPKTSGVVFARQAINGSRTPWKSCIQPRDEHSCLRLCS